MNNVIYTWIRQVKTGQDTDRHTEGRREIDRRKKMEIHREREDRQTGRKQGTTENRHSQ